MSPSMHREDRFPMPEKTPVHRFSTLSGAGKTIHDFSPEAAAFELVLVRQLRGPHLST